MEVSCDFCVNKYNIDENTCAIKDYTFVCEACAWSNKLDWNKRYIYLTSAVVHESTKGA